MGWLFKAGYSRQQLIVQRSSDFEHVRDDGTEVRSKCLAHCYRGGVFSGVLWTVWERSVHLGEIEVEKRQRWIGCDLLRCERNFGWGYKDMEESMHPHFYSCPLGYLSLVPLDEYGGHAEWREGVQQYHAKSAEKCRAKRASRMAVQ